MSTDPATEPQGEVSALDESIALLTGRRNLGPLGAPAFADAATDACSVAAAAIGRRAVAANPAAESGLSGLAAPATASGLLGWRIRLPRGWRATGGLPVIAGQPEGYLSLLPTRGVQISSPQRTSRALGRGPAVPDGFTLTPDMPADTRWWRLISWSLRRRRPDVLALLALGLLGGLLALLLPAATAAIFGSAVPQGDVRRVVGVLGVVGVGSVAAALVMVARGELTVRLRDSTDTLLSPAVFARVLRLPVTAFQQESPGATSNRVLSVESARQQVDDTVVATLLTSVFAMVNVVFLYVADIRLGLITTLVIAVVLAVSLRLQLRARSRLPAVLETRSRCDATLLALVRAAVIWRVAAAEDRALARWAAEQGAATRVLAKRLRAVAVCTPVVVAAPTLVLAAFTLAVAVVPSARLLPGSVTAPGTFLTLYAAVTQLTMAMLALTSQFVTLSELGPTMSRLRPVVDQPEERQRAGSHPGALGGAVALSGVVYGYRRDRAPLFDGLTLTVAPGEFVAIVGPSGAGKSTILRLLLGFAEPWQGTVTYDGRDLAGLDPGAVRRQLGVVLQSSRPLGATVRECVAGPRELADEHLWDLLERSGLAGEVRALDGGLDADLGPGASRMSGGQRQRLAIAAALAADPAVLLFDEATSALDNITQATVMRTVLASRATRIVIAHRLSTVRHADRVLVVADGRVVESGPPAELVAAGGLFARLAARQET